VAIDSVTPLQRMYTYDDSDVISFHIYASWFSPPYLVGKTLTNVSTMESLKYALSVG